MPRSLDPRPRLPADRTPAYHPYEVHTGVFSSAQCRRIVALGEAAGAEEAGVEARAGEEPAPALRRARVAWLAPEPSCEWIYRKLAVVARRANRRYGFELTGFDEDLQYTVYDRPGAFYTWHQDGLDTGVAHRKLSLVVPLSDPSDYGGAHLDLFGVSADLVGDDLDLVRRECAQQGAVVVFPSFEYHRVTPLEHGSRRSLVCWVSGPRLR